MLAALFLAELPARAQQNAGSEQMARYRLADSYLRTGSYDRAIPLLEQLHAQNPASEVYYEKLKQAYAGHKQYEKAIALVEQRIERAGAGPDPVSEKAALLLKQGAEQKALETWDRAISLGPDRPGTYRTVYHSMIENRRYEEAIEVLERGRRALDRSSAFALDMAYLYGLTGRHEEAAREYLTILRSTPDRLSLVKQRLSRFGQETGALKRTLTVVEDAVEKEPLYRPYRELAGWLYLQTGRYERGFEAFQAIDRLEEERGRVVYEFARRAASAEAFGAARRAYRYVLDTHPDGPVTPDALLGLAEMERHRALAAADSPSTVGDSTRALLQAAPARMDPARAAYERFVRMYSGHPRHAYALFRLGYLQLHVYRDLVAANRRFDEVIRRHPDSPQAPRALLERGRVYVARDSLDEARQAFTHLQDTVESDAVSAQARYEMALLEFYEGRFRSAHTRARALGRNGARDVANDALELQVLIQENRGPDSLDRALRTFADARLAARQHRYERAHARLDTLLARFSEHTLADEALAEKGDLYRREGRPTEAAEAFRTLAEEQPNSPLADRSLFAAARLYELRLGRPDRATELYTRLLDRYPGSPFVPRARVRIRALRDRA